MRLSMRLLCAFVFLLSACTVEVCKDDESAYSVDVTCMSVFDTSGSSEDVREMALGLDDVGRLGRVKRLNDETVYEQIFGKNSGHMPIPERDWDRLMDFVSRDDSSPHDSCLSPKIEIQNLPKSAFTRNTTADYTIGRAIMEMDVVPLWWRNGFNMLDEVWVPSNFHAEVLRKAGVENAVVVPECINNDEFVLDEEAKERATKVRASLPSETSFVFFSVFSWDHRKNYEMLLKTFSETFPASSRGDIVLLVKTWPRGISGGDDVLPLKKKAADILGMEALPANIVFYTGQGKSDDTQLTRKEYLALHHAADAFVLPTHGEGWCRPCMEAMACGKTLVATNWSAMVDYMSPTNSMPLPYTLTNVPAAHTARTEEFHLGIFEFHRWAEPSASDLSRLMLQLVAETPEERQQRGEAARQTMVQHYNRSTIARVMRRRLDQIARDLAKSPDCSSSASASTDAGASADADANADAGADTSAKDALAAIFASSSRAEAILDHVTAVLLQLKDPAALTALGSAPPTEKQWKRYKKEQLGQAATHLAGAIEGAECPDQRAHLLQVQCTILAKQGKFKAARASCEEVVALQPERSARAHTLLGVLRAKSKKQEQISAAKRHFERALEIDPGFERASSGLAVLSKKQNAE